MHMIL